MDKTLYKPFVSKLKNKKYSVYVKGPNGNPKLIHFGDSNFKHNQNEKQRDLYDKRSKFITNKFGKKTYLDKNTSNFWARTYLWGL